MNFFSQLFFVIVYQPQLNILQLYFNLTGDIGYSIILIGLTVNLLLWPLMMKSYLSSQKMRIFQPQIRKIQAKYQNQAQKDEKLSLPQIQEMQKELADFNQKHGIDNRSTFLILIVQILFGSGLFGLIRDLSRKDEIDGLYSFLFPESITSFPEVAFGFLEIDLKASNYIWLPIIGLIFSLMYSFYTFKLAPKISLTENQTQDKDATKTKKLDQKSDKTSPDQEQDQSQESKADKPLFDPEAFAKTQQFNFMFILPIVSFIANISWSAGVSLYFVTLTALNLFRQILITQYYASHLGKFVQDIANSDPSSQDDNLANNLENTAEPEILAQQPVSTSLESHKKHKNNLKKAGNHDENNATNTSSNLKQKQTDKVSKSAKKSKPPKMKDLNKEFEVFLKSKK